MLTRFLFLFAFLAIGLTSCSKEKQVERQLIKKDGKWNIKSVNYKYYVGSEQQAAESYPAAGTMEFKKGGSYMLNISFGGGVYETSSGTWTNTEDKITVIADGEATVLKITDGPKKGKMVLEQTDSSPSTNEKEVYTFNLERAD